MSDSAFDRDSRSSDEKEKRKPHAVYVNPAGYFFLDRPLPFLVVFRDRADGDSLSPRLVTSQAAHLIIKEEKEESAEALKNKLNRHLQPLAGEEEGFLIVEVWTQTSDSARDQSHLAQPRFELFTDEGEDTAPVVRDLALSLKRFKIDNLKTDVRVSCFEDPPLWPGPLELNLPGSRRFGIQVNAIYRDPRAQELYPFVFDRLRLHFTDCLRQAIFDYLRSRMGFEAPHYDVLGPRFLEDTVVQVDHELAQISRSFDFLLLMTPVNAVDAWEDFQQSNFKLEPTFYYRPLPLDPEVLKRRLFSVPIEKVEDPTLGYLLREKQEELDRQITMLRDRNTRSLLFTSLQLYGEIERDLLKEAEELLSVLPDQDESYSPEFLNDREFARLAHEELSAYRRKQAAFPDTVEIRDDVPPGLLVSKGRLFIGKGTHIARSRAAALLHHEIGTHVLTYFNGRSQPLSLMAGGLAGYEELQEGLAVFSEYLSGGLTVPRLRVLAARVVAAQRLMDKHSFLEVFETLVTAHFAPVTAFRITMRTFRGGGFTKDIVYLRGFHKVLRYLKEGKELEVLYPGKIALDHVDAVRELSYREIVRPPLILPHYLEDGVNRDRLEKARSGLTFLDMVQRRVS